MNADFKIGGGWGNHINWFSPSEFGKETAYYSVYGHKPNIPRVGQTLMGEFEKSFIKFEFIQVEQETDPPDMFFGKVKAIERILK